MDLQEKIFLALENKDFDDFTKIRWIYLYVCEMFSYDTRYIFANQSMKESTYNTTIDIKNVEDFEVICYTLARILVDALAIFGYEAEIVRETNNYLTHVYVIVKHKGMILKLDPTKRYDVTRVKMNSNTIDFKTLSNDEHFPELLLDTDKQIAPDFGGLYFSSDSDKIIIEKILEEINTYAMKNKLSEEEVFLKKLEALCSMINSKTNLKRYDDIDFYYSYLLKYFKMNKKEVIQNGITTYENCFYIKPVVLFNRNDKNMKDIINISYIHYKNLPPMFYLIKKEGESFKMREIFKDEALELLSEYETLLCQYMLEAAAEKLPTGKKNGIIY